MVPMLYPVIVILVATVAGLLQQWEADIVMLVARHRHSCCIHLLTSNLASVQEKGLRLQERASSSGFFTTMLLSLNLTTGDSTCSRNLFVLLGSSPRDQSLLRKVSFTSQFSHQTWLILQQSHDNKDFLREVRLPFDSLVLLAIAGRHIVTLMEVYHMDNALSSIEMFYGYSADSGSVITHQSLNERRRSLRGADVQLQFPYCLKALFNTKTGSEEHYGGFFGSVHSVLQRRLNFGPHESQRTVVVEVRSMIHMDVDNFSYTAPILTTSSVLLLRLPDESDVRWGSYLWPFAPRLWFTLAGLALGISCYLTTMYHVIQQTTNGESRDPGFPLYESLFIMVNAIEQQGSDNEPRSVTCRLVYLVCYLLSVIVLASYSASLTSLFTVRNDIAAFSSVEALLRSHEYKFGVLNGSAEQELLQWSPSPVVAKLRVKTRKYEDLFAALQLVCSQKFVLFTTHELLHSFVFQLPCRIGPVPDWELRVDWAFRVPQADILWSPLAYNCLMFRETGLLQKLKQDAFSPHLVNIPDNIQVVTFYHITPVITVLAMALLVSITLGLIEWTMYSIREHRTQISQQI